MSDISSSNIQGTLHVDARLGSRKRKIRKRVKTLYVNRPVLNAEDIIAWAKANGFEKTLLPDDMHVTIAFSKEPLEWPKPMRDTTLTINVKDAHVELFGREHDCGVLQFDSEDLQERWEYFKDTGASWDWPDYSPHISITYNVPDGFDVDDIEPYSGKIVLGPEEFSEVTEGWGDNVVEKMDDLIARERIQKVGRRNNSKDQKMIQQMHDHACSLGANCSVSNTEQYVDDSDALTPRDDSYDKVARIAKVDDALGLVFGYAIVCNKDGKPYYDLNVDKMQDGSYKRVPEHIPEDAMLKAAVNFMQSANRPGNEMHAGPDVGTYVFAFPMTADIAKAFGIQTKMTGLMIAYKPSPEVFAKYKDGTYTGFSIEGRRVSAEEVE